MNTLSEQQLLRDYSERQSEEAFAELVRRHIAFVYAAALRMARDTHLAEDVTQGVFVALAQNARELSNHPVLSGWLHRTAQNIAANAVRSAVRRRAREQEIATMNELPDAEPEAVWDDVAPHLDAALGELNAGDRDALLLRYFERKSARDMAHILGTSEEAAQKRVSRAVERLRELFANRGVTVGTSGLVVLISTNAVPAAPAGLALTISSVGALAGTIVPTSTAIALVKIIAMTTLQRTIIGATLVAAVGTGIYEARQALNLRGQIETLQRDQAEQVQQWQREREEASARLAALHGENARLKSSVANLQKPPARDLQSAKLAAPTLPPATLPAPANAQPNENDLPKDSWSDAGFATLQKALQTRGWAVVNGNRERFKESVFVTDGARKVLEDMFVQMIEASKDPDKAKTIQQILENKFGVEEGLLMPMMAENQRKGFTGYRILSQESPSPEETTLQVETQMTSAPAKKELLRYRRFGRDWKMVVDEEFIQSMR